MTGPSPALGDWLAAEGIVADDGPGAIADVPRVRALLVTAAREGHSVSYSELLDQLGLRFTRPRMRALCRTLDRIDEDGRAAGEPALAVLVVREGDRLPGQGWWASVAHAARYEGAWTGPEAHTFVAARQARAFGYWQSERLR